MKVLRIKQSNFGDSDLRLDASYHLSDGPLTEIKLKKSPYPLTTLSKEADEIFTGNIFKRVYVDNPRTGFPFLTPSDMMRVDIDGNKFISRKHTRNVDRLTVKMGWILVSCSGTLGNTAFANAEFHNRVATHDLIRIIPNEANTLRGYLYAYLSSRFGYGLLTQSGYGGVVKHVEPHHIEDIKVPVLPNRKQQEIHNLIMEASDLRVEANRLLKESHVILTQAVKFSRKRIKQKVSIKTLLDSHQKRFEAEYFVSEGNDIREHVMTINHKLLQDLSEPIFRPGIFKRHYVQEGTDFLGGADIVKSIPKSEKRLSNAKTKHLDSMKIQEDWILVTCGGTIGYSVLVNSYLAGKAASQHILRVIADDIPSGYLFAFMSSKLGLKAIQSFSYGSVIPQIEPHHLDLLPIPILEGGIMSNIHEMIMKYKENLAKAIKNELKAVELVEKEIESWQEL